MDRQRRTAYLDRLGFEAPPPPDADALAALHESHLTSLPFENLSIYLDEPMELDESWLVDKVTVRRRGGFCYELNGAFAALLDELGYTVERHSVRVYGGDGSLGPPFDHLALVVRCPHDEGPWLVDVGFGDSFVRPLPFATGSAITDRAGRFELVATAAGDVDLRRDGTPTYRIDPRRYDLADFGPTWWYNRTSPESSFTAGPVCTILTADGRVTVAGRKVVVTRDGDRDERIVVDDTELLAIYREAFGIALDRIPGG